MNDAELRMLTEQPNLVRAARDVMAMGPRIVVAKQGEYGAALFTEDGFFALPGYPLEEVLDPTGAGDSFAGGFLGYLDANGPRSRRRPGAAPRDDLRLRDGLLQRGAVRHRAGAAPHAWTRSTSASRSSSCITHLEAVPLECASPAKAPVLASLSVALNPQIAGFSTTDRALEGAAMTTEQTIKPEQADGVSANGRDVLSVTDERTGQALRAADHGRHDPRGRAAADQGRPRTTSA